MLFVPTICSLTYRSEHLASAHPNYARLLRLACECHAGGRNPDGIGAADVDLARLYAYAFRALLGPFYRYETLLGRVIHLASLLSGSTEKNRRLGWNINATASLDLLELCLSRRVERVLFPSSLAVWGGKLPDPLPEDFETWPDGLYGVTKVAVERLGHYYHRAHGLDFRGVRLPVIVSPHAPDGAASAYASHAFRAALRGEAYRFKVRPETQVSMMYVKDCLRVLAGLLGADPARLTRRVYNVHALSPTALELAEAVRARVPGADVGFAPEAAVADLIDSWPAVIGDASARRDWAWRPAWSLEALASDFGT